MIATETQFHVADIFGADSWSRIRAETGSGETERTVEDARVDAPRTTRATKTAAGRASAADDAGPTTATDDAAVVAGLAIAAGFVIIVATAACTLFI